MLRSQVMPSQTPLISFRSGTKQHLRYFLLTLWHQDIQWEAAGANVTYNKCDHSDDQTQKYVVGLLPWFLAHSSKTLGISWR